MAVMVWSVKTRPPALMFLEAKMPYTSLFPFVPIWMLLLVQVHWECDTDSREIAVVVMVLALRDNRSFDIQGYGRMRTNPLLAVSTLRSSS